MKIYWKIVRIEDRDCLSFEGLGKLDVLWIDEDQRTHIVKLSSSSPNDWSRWKCWYMKRPNEKKLLDIDQRRTSTQGKISSTKPGDLLSLHYNWYIAQRIDDDINSSTHKHKDVNKTKWDPLLTWYKTSQHRIYSHCPIKARFAYNYNVHWWR